MSDNDLAQENPPANEAVIIQELAERLKAKIIKDNPTGIMRRDAHPKMHGVVKAEFIVEPELPEHLRVGIFKEAKTYPAWIRFSNQSGTLNPDIERDIRGMAIKLMGVPGKKLQDGEEDAQTHDFILISTHVFVTKDVAEFNDLLKALTGSILSKTQFFATHWRVVGNLIKSLKQFANPLQTRYFSTTPYLWGPQAAKYSAIPRVADPDPIPDNPEDNYMRSTMVAQLAREAVEFDFSVQLQTDAVTMPIEDPGQEWREDESPFQKVATIRIPQQAFDTQKQDEFGENLSYSPWHCIAEHRPLGGINRARRVIYPFISKFRHDKNKVPVKEPDSWEI